MKQQTPIISQAMGLIEEATNSTNIRNVLHNIVNLGLLISLVLISLAAFSCVGVKLDATVVLSESMEPAFKRGDVLLLNKNKDPIRVGEIILFNLDGDDIPVIHRVIKVHENNDTGKIQILTKGDNNEWDDTYLYPPGQFWLEQHHIIGRAVGYMPYVGWLTLIFKEYPFLKFALLGGAAWFYVVS